MFSYYGSKSKIVKYYPPPKYGKIIEPFAGSARYSLRFFDREILLVDKYPVIIEVWKYLQEASEKDILSLPDLKRGDDLRKMGLSLRERLFMGFFASMGSAHPGNIVSKFAADPSSVSWGSTKKRIAGSLYKIRHWEIRLGTYEDLPNEPATWFIDPPYQKEGRHYTESDIDYSRLAEWSQSRLGHVIVCETVGADWLPFRFFRSLNDGQSKKAREAIWTNYEGDHSYSQKELFEPSIYG